MYVIIVMNNIAILYYNYFLRITQKTSSVIINLLNVLVLPFLFPIALLTAQQELKKYMYLFVSYMSYSRISQDKRFFFNLANKI